MQINAIILGAGGYGGGELLRLLSAHPVVSSLQAVSASHAGRPVTAAHPHLHTLDGMNFVTEPRWCSESSDARLVVFSVMPHGELAGQFDRLTREWPTNEEGGPSLLIDLSGDFRLASAAGYRDAYGAEHPCPEHLGSFVYGLPEHNRQEIAAASRIANPGCFATAMNLALLPIADVAGLGLIAVSGSTGSSGSGAIPSDTTHHPTRAADFRAYKMLTHQHQAEVEMMLRARGAAGYHLSFVPHSAPMVRGIFVTAQLLLPEGIGPESLLSRYRACYERTPFVRLVRGSPRVATTAGSNFAEVGVAVNGRHAAVMCALDNLGKGMAGQAVQNMNIALGLDERAGLWEAAVYP